MRGAEGGNRTRVDCLQNSGGTVLTVHSTADIADSTKTSGRSTLMPYLSGKGHEVVTSVMNGSDERLLITVEEAAAIIGIGRSKVYELIAAGKLPGVTRALGERSIRVNRRRLIEWVESL